MVSEALRILATGQRRRRAALLSIHCLRNLAYFRAGWHNNYMLIPKDDFWLTSSGNFLDTCVLDWCKLFADKRAKHYWEGLVSDKQAFLAGLLKALGISETEFSEIIRDIRRYRDKFIAHLDDQNVMEIPDLKVPKDSTMFLYKHLLTEGVNPEHPLPNDIEEYYKFHMAYAEKIYLQKET